VANFHHKWLADSSMTEIIRVT